MKNKFLSGIAIGAGIVIGAAGVSVAADNTRNVHELWGIVNNINKERQYVLDHYCPYELFPDAKSSGECAARFGWDNFNAPDGQQQYDKIMRAKITQAWVGDMEWLKRQLDSSYNY